MALHRIRRGQAIDPPSADTPQAPKIRQFPGKPTGQLTKMG
jgi:hypothetical protein